MRVAVIYAGAAKGNALVPFAKSVVSGIESMGHRVDLIDARADDGLRLPGYEYLVVVSEPVSFISGKIPDVVPAYLAKASSLVGKKGAAFLRSSGLFSGKAMGTLMRAMEKEGMWVNWSEVAPNPSQAEAAAKRIGS